MKRIGITGGIGSGKSVVSDILRCFCIPTYDADKASKALIQTDIKLQNGLKALMGETIYTSDGLDKKRMAQLIFNDKALLAKVNALIHPAVINDFISWCELQKSETVACESALLFESAMYKYVDKSITVTAPVETRIERCILRDHATKEQISARIANQISDEDRIKFSDYIIINDGRNAILPQLWKILEQL